MAQYLLMLRDNGPRTFEGMSPEQMQKSLQRYRTWSDGLRQRGKLAGGAKLTNRDGRVMRRNSSSVAVTDGPFAEAKEIIGGYFIVQANSYDEAVGLAKDCPHLDFGTIEVREIEITA